VARTLLVVVTLLAGIGLTACSQSAADTFRGAVLHSPYRVPATELVDTSGHPYSLADSTRKRLTLVFFGYTHCPDVCQVVMSTLASAVARLDPQERRRMEVVFVTTDPARDTRPVLRRYLDRFDPGFVGLTGPLARVEDLARPLGIYFEEDERLPSGGYEVEHSASVLAVRDGRASLVWSPTATPAEVAADVQRLLAAGR
jgi:protein SCO1/2